MNPNTLHINFYDLAFLGTIFIGLTFVYLLWFTKRTNQQANRFLGLALFSIVLWVARVSGIDIGLGAYFPHRILVSFQFSLATGPLIFFYVLKITRPEYKFRRTDLLHFSPLLLEPGIQLIFQQLNPVLPWLAFISVIIYLYLSHRLIQDFYDRLRPVLMDRPRFAFRRLDRMLPVLGLLCLLSVLNDIFCFTFAFALIIMAAEAILKPDSIVQVTMPITDRSDAKEKSRRLKEAVAANRLYEDAELTLTTLALKLNIHPHDLSRIINLGLEKNFSDFINEFRVREVARKMQDPAYDRLTLLGIAYESGFNSKRTFNRVFKEITRKTPVEYKNELRKEGPIDKLAPLAQMRPVILRSESPPNWVHEKLNRNYMFKNYFKIAIRSLKHYKLFTTLNVFGLASGMACSILILLWVQDEHSYDKFNVNAPQVYRLTDNLSGVDAAVTPLPFAEALKRQMPIVKNYARLIPLHSVVTIDKRKFDEKDIFYADPSFLQIFSYPLLLGNKATVLSRPDAVVITALTARKYFGDKNAIGRVIHIDDDVTPHNYIVTGVLKDIPHNSHLKFGMLLPLIAFEKSSNYNMNNPQEWGNYIVYTYLQMEDQFRQTTANISLFEKQLDQFHKANDVTHLNAHYTMQPLADIHLHSRYLLDVDGQGSAEYTNIFSIVAIFILVIACINFMNLSTALAGQRSKEVGLRKTIGALRFQLIIQFLGESLLVSFISLVISVVIAWLLLPLFNNLASKNITVDLLNAKIIGSLFGIAVLVGLVSGSYPAFFLSSFNPARVLKGMKIAGGQKTFLRNGLVIFQFAISVILMVSTLVVNNQLKFIQNRDMGYDKENLMYIQMPQVGDLRNNYAALKAALSQNAAIKNYTLIEHLPTDLTTGTTNVTWSGKDPNQQTIFPHIGSDGSFIKTFGMHIIAGRAFDDNSKADEANYVVNETALKVMGMTPATAVGKRITMNGNPGEIIGVVKDFNFKPVHQGVEPLILRYTKQGGFAVIRTSPANMQQVIANLKSVFQSVYPDYPFAYGFVDQDLSKLYITEQRMGKLFNVFSVVSIIISCLGLFGLATFATQRRIKEIGVRRVLGASAHGIVGMLAKDFIKLVLVALVVAFPLAWWIMNKWLDSYVYRIQLSWWMFALAGVMSLMIAFLTISYQSVKAALANPVKSLRTE